MRFTLFLLLLSGQALAIPVLHQIRPDSSFTQITTLESCSFMNGRSDGAACNPALFPYEKNKGVSFKLATITDGDSVDTGQTLLFSEIEKKDVEELFNKRSFITWDANSSINFLTPYFHLYYRPLTVTADILVLNPAFPEISMALVKSKQLGVTAGWILHKNDFLDLSLGTSIFHYSRKEFIGSFSLVDLTSRDIDELIDFEDRSGLAGDLGLNLDPVNTYFPTVSLVIKNLGSDFENKTFDVQSEKILRPLLVYETYSKVGLSYRFDTEYGGIGTELNAPFEGVLEDYLEDYNTLGLGYFLGGFEFTGALSRYQKVLGGKFSSKSLSIGIFYAFNQSLGDFYSREERLAGMHVQVSL